MSTLESGQANRGSGGGRAPTMVSSLAPTRGGLSRFSPISLVNPQISALADDDGEKSGGGGGIPVVPIRAPVHLVSDNGRHVVCLCLGGDSCAYLAARKGRAGTVLRCVVGVLFSLVGRCFPWGGAMTGLRVWAAAVCLALAAFPASGEEDCGDLRSCLRPLADDVARALDEAGREDGGRLSVRFRPARTEPSGVTVYCRALSMGLRNALHGEVRAFADRYVMDFDVRRADRGRVEPPEVGAVWAWDRTGAARDILSLDAYFVLPDGRDRRFAGRIPVDVLSANQRACLFSFSPGVDWAEAGEAGELFEEPTFRPDAWVADYEAGARLRVLGRLKAADGSSDVWSVVVWQDPETRERRNLFAMGLGGGMDDVAAPPPPPPEPGPVLEVGDVFRDCADCPEMVVVPSGSFMMGSPPSEEGRDDDEGPVHRVSISSAFAVGVYEVTFEEWDACVSAGDCGGYRPDDEGWGREKRPVINVSRSDARVYVRWLSQKTDEDYLLLSESEWEYVARAGTTTRYHWGDAIGRNRANCNGCGSRWDGELTSPVGSFGANAFGLHDVHGNVWEWVEDCYNDSYAGAPNDGSVWSSGTCSRHVLRGGSWYDDPRFLRAANRGGSGTGYRDNNFGFRVARTFTP